MEQEVRERVTLPAAEIDELFSSDDAAAVEKAPRVGFNFNKLIAVVCMFASASVAVSIVMWMLFG